MISYNYEREVNTIAQKTIAFRVEDEFHSLVKIQAIKKGKTLQDYIVDLIKTDIEKDAEK